MFDYLDELIIEKVGSESSGMKAVYLSLNVIVMELLCSPVYLVDTTLYYFPNYVSTECGLNLIATVTYVYRVRTPYGILFMEVVIAAGGPLLRLERSNVYRRTLTPTVRE